MSEWRYIIAAYGVTWVVLAAYALYLGAATRRADQVLSDIRREGGDT